MIPILGEYKEGIANQYIAHKLDKPESSQGCHWKYVRGWQLIDDVREQCIPVLSSDINKNAYSRFLKVLQMNPVCFNLSGKYRTWGFFHQQELAKPALCWWHGYITPGQMIERSESEGLEFKTQYIFCLKIFDCFFQWDLFISRKWILLPLQVNIWNGNLTNKNIN